MERLTGVAVDEIRRPVGLWMRVGRAAVPAMRKRARCRIPREAGAVWHLTRGDGPGSSLRHGHRAEARTPEPWFRLGAVTTNRSDAADRERMSRVGRATEERRRQRTLPREQTAPGVELMPGQTTAGTAGPV